MSAGSMKEPLAVREAPASYVLDAQRVRPGYKQTEVGVIPEDWEVTSIGAFAGGDENIVDGPFGSNLKNTDYTSKGVPVLQGLNITGDRFVWKEVRYISENKAKDLFRSNARAGDLLSVKIGSVGFSAIIDDLEGHSFAIIPANLLRVRFRKDDSDPKFAYFALTSFAGKQRLKDLAGNTAQPALGLTGFRKFCFAAPPTKAEQEAIAEALGDADALIEALEQLIAKKRDLKQGAMEELLTGKKRLPGFSGEWEVSTFGDVFNITAGGDVDPKRTLTYQDQTHCYPIYSNALTDFGLYGYCSYADHRSESITVTARGKLGFANFRDHAYTAIGRVLVLQSKQKADGRFFAEVINSCIKFSIESTGVPQLTAPQISTYKLPVPSLSEQTAIATLLSDMDAELAALETRLAKTRLLKQGMMHNLLTGKIRLI